MSVSSSSFKTEVVTSSEPSVGSAGNDTAGIMACSAEKKEKSPNGYVQTMKSSRNEENRSIDVFTSRKFYTVFVLISLAKQESASQKNGKKEKSGKAIFVVFHNVCVCNSDRYSGCKKKDRVHQR